MFGLPSLTQRIQTSALRGSSKLQDVKSVLLSRYRAFVHCKEKSCVQQMLAPRIHFSRSARCEGDHLKLKDSASSRLTPRAGSPIIPVPTAATCRVGVDGRSATPRQVASYYCTDLVSPMNQAYDCHGGGGGGKWRKGASQGVAC